MYGFNLVQEGIYEEVDNGLDFGRFNQDFQGSTFCLRENLRLGYINIRLCKLLLIQGLILYNKEK